MFPENFSSFSATYFYMVFGTQLIIYDDLGSKISHNTLHGIDPIISKDWLVPLQNHKHMIVRHAVTHTLKAIFVGKTPMTATGRASLVLLSSVSLLDLHGYLIVTTNVKLQTFVHKRIAKLQIKELNKIVKLPLKRLAKQQKFELIKIIKIPKKNIIMFLFINPKDLNPIGMKPIGRHGLKQNNYKPYDL
jgi:hypothetical protein